MFTKLLVLLIFSLFHIFCVESVEARTTSGVVKGKVIHVLNKTINQFLNIPYAEPPLGKLRFARPLALNQSGNIIDGTIACNECYQYKQAHTPEQSEDCLFLNIWSQVNQNSSILKPVMFWIHGGGFKHGSGNAFNGSALATYDVIVVTINYRLGPFGFLYGGTQPETGNLALYDQNMALKWVRDNVNQFGGNPQQITIFGESAGSFSVSAQIMSPLSNGLFKRAILGSGAVFDNINVPIVSKQTALLQAKEMAKHFNCADDSQWLNCLRAVDPKKINHYTGFANYPSPETEFLPLIGQTAMKSHNYSTEIDIMAGIMRNEGSILAHESYPEAEQLKNAEEFLSFIKNRIHFPELNYEKIAEFYLKGIDTNNTEALKLAFYSFYGDIHIACPCYHFAKAFSVNTPKRNVYFFLWNYTTEVSVGCKKDMGICHGSENTFVFGKPVLHHHSLLEKVFSEDTMKIWTNFAKNGQPLNGFPTEYHWPRLTETGVINSVTKMREFHPLRPNHIIDNYLADTCDGFWKNYFE